MSIVTCLDLSRQDTLTAYGCRKLVVLNIYKFFMIIDDSSTVASELLLKTGRLSFNEFEHIQQHPYIGASIINTIPSIADILPVVVSHHERMDGNGYPRGLKGLAIPLWARMTVVADTYDALTSDRPYRGKAGHTPRR